LDDQEFVVAFETDNPADFLDLVQELRETKASSYTLRDTPMFTCRQRTLCGVPGGFRVTLRAMPLAVRNGYAFPLSSN